MVPRRHLSCWRALIQLDEVMVEASSGRDVRGRCGGGCAGHMRSIVDGNDAVDTFNASSYDNADRDFHKKVRVQRGKRLETLLETLVFPLFRSHLLLKYATYIMPTALKRLFAFCVRYFAFTCYRFSI